MIMTKILVLTTTFPRWINDTMPAFVYDLSKRLKENGMEIFVLAPHHEGTKTYEIIDGMKTYRFPYFYPTKYQRLAYGGGILSNLKSNLARIQVPLFLLSEIYYSFKIVWKEKIDVINSHWLIPQGLVGAICNKTFGTKHVLTVHAAGLFSLERLPFKMKIAGFITKNTDKIVVVSSYIGERLLDLIPSDLREEVNDKMDVFSMGVAIKEYKHVGSDEEKLKSKYGINTKFTLLFIGRLSEKKGVSYLIEAMSKIILQANANLIICGDGPLSKDLGELVRRKRLEKFVKFAGYVSNSDKLDYLFLSDILIVPSIVTQSGDTEGLPVVVLEGLAAGIPIIVSDVSGIKDVIINGYNGFLVEPESSDGITEKALSLLDNEELRVYFSKNALESSKKYDWNIIAEKYIKIFRENGV